MYVVKDNTRTRIYYKFLKNYTQIVLLFGIVLCVVSLLQIWNKRCPQFEEYMNYTRLKKQGGNMFVDDPDFYMEYTTSNETYTKPDLFLFIGILSRGNNTLERMALRDSWGNEAQNFPESIARFVLTVKESDQKVQAEVQKYKDVIFVSGQVQYSTILQKTMACFKYAVENYDVAFILKADDDSFINVQPLLQKIRTFCTNSDCKNEKIYAGSMQLKAEVIVDPKHRWYDPIFQNVTKLDHYLPYALGGGYIISGDIAKVLVVLHNHKMLLQTPIEDATLGLWMGPLDIRRVHLTTIFTYAFPCCFSKPVTDEYLSYDLSDPAQYRKVSRLMKIAIRYKLCGRTPWLILHKITSPNEMRILAQLVKFCKVRYQGKLTGSLPSTAPK